MDQEDIPFEVYFDDAVIIDSDVFQLWCAGMRVEEAAKLRRVEIPVSDVGDRVAVVANDGDVAIPSSQRESHSPLQTCADSRTVLRDTVDQYRVFKQLKRQLRSPDDLSTLPMFQMVPAKQCRFIHMFFEFDDEIMRVLVGQHLSANLRRKLKSTAEPRIREKSFRRQFDNLKEVLAMMDKMPDSSGESLSDHVSSTFWLPNDLVSVVACVVVIT